MYAKIKWRIKILVEIQLGFEFWTSLENLMLRFSIQVMKNAGSKSRNVRQANQSVEIV